MVMMMMMMIKISDNDAKYADGRTLTTRLMCRTRGSCETAGCRHGYLGSKRYHTLFYCKLFKVRAFGVNVMIGCLV